MFEEIAFIIAVVVIVSLVTGIARARRAINEAVAYLNRKRD